MKIGIVSDSHGQRRRLRAALAELLDRGAEAVVHCGDVGSADCLTTLAEAGVPAAVVAGNMDARGLKAMTTRAAEAGLQFDPDVVMLPLEGGRYLAATHGNNAAVLGRLIAGDGIDYVCHGHTHRKRDERIGSTRVINPGALAHGRPTSCALLDTDADTLEFVDLD